MQPKNTVQSTDKSVPTTRNTTGRSNNQQKAVEQFVNTTHPHIESENQKQSENNIYKSSSNDNDTFGKNKKINRNQRGNETHEVSDDSIEVCYDSNDTIELNDDSNGYDEGNEANKDWIDENCASNDSIDENDQHRYQCYKKFFGLLKNTRFSKTISFPKFYKALLNLGLDIDEYDILRRIFKLTGNIKQKLDFQTFYLFMENEFYERNWEETMFYLESCYRQLVLQQESNPKEEPNNANSNRVSPTNAKNQESDVNLLNINHMPGENSGYNNFEHIREATSNLDYTNQIDESGIPEIKAEEPASNMNLYPKNDDFDAPTQIPLHGIAGDKNIEESDHVEDTHQDNLVYLKSSFLRSMIVDGLVNTGTMDMEEIETLIEKLDLDCERSIGIEEFGCIVLGCDGPPEDDIEFGRRLFGDFIVEYFEEND